MCISEPETRPASRGAGWLLVFAFVAFAITAGRARGTVAAEAAARGQDLTLPDAGEEPNSKNAWVPDLLYGIIDSPNSSALDALYDAAFAAGPAIVPKLEAALADDRTAEFAAQSLAFIGSQQAVQALAGLVRDPRDLNLRRFYYGALGELDNPLDNGILLHVIRNANNEPDRSVTDAAIIALTVRSDPSLVAPLEQAEAQLSDPVIRDDLAGAIAIIRSRVRFVASQRNPSAATTIEEAVHTYFLPAILSLSAPIAGRHRRRSHAGGTGSAARAKFEIQHVEYSPDKNRALARVIFTDPVAVARYWLVLRKKGSGWAVSTAWLGAEEEKSKS